MIDLDEDKALDRFFEKKERRGKSDRDQNQIHQAMEGVNNAIKGVNDLLANVGNAKKVVKPV